MIWLYSYIFHCRASEKWFWSCASWAEWIYLLGWTSHNQAGGVGAWRISFMLAWWCFSWLIWLKGSWSPQVLLKSPLTISHYGPNWKLGGYHNHRNYSKSLTILFSSQRLICPTIILCNNLDIVNMNNDICWTVVIVNCDEVTY